jgi:hypothetical protein
MTEFSLEIRRSITHTLDDRVIQRATEQERAMLAMLDRSKASE